MMKYVFLLILTVCSEFMNAQTQIIAHRGFFQSNPSTTENSLEALKNAQDLKVYGSEFDVRMTADGILVVNHDEHHAGMEVSESSLAKLRTARLANGEELPTLEQYLEMGRLVNGVKLIVELKPAETKILEDMMVQKALQLVSKTKTDEQVEFISFSLNICREIKKREPNYLVHYLNGDLSPQQLKYENLDGLDYHYKILLEKHPAWIAEARKLGLMTNSWTVNDIEIYKKLKSLGIDFVTTNIPDQLINL